MRISYAGKNRRFSPQGDTLRNSDITILLAKADKIDTLISKQTLWNYWFDSRSSTEGIVWGYIICLIRLCEI
ncbi:MAG: hypothetical protein ACFNVV_06255 [Bacteroidota bacterium]